MSNTDEQQGLFGEWLPEPEDPEAGLPEARGRRYDCFADVAFALPLTPLTYGIPAHLAGTITAGALVEARLRGRIETGCVVAIHADEPARQRLGELKGLQPVLRRVTPEFDIDDELRELSAWISDYYMCSLGEALACVSFIGFHDLAPPRQLQAWKLAPADPTGARDSAMTGLTRRQRQVLEWMRASEANQPDGAFTRRTLHEQMGVTNGVLRRLAEANWLTPCEVEEAPPGLPDPTPMEELARDAEPTHTLTPDQRRALETIHTALDAGDFLPCLLQGVTGSGKTEVYLQALARAVELGRQGIVLVPEISLTPQTVARFRARFGQRVGVYHSRLTAREKLNLWRHLRGGRIDVVVGARSALFAPMPRLGLIVVDEEHEGTYKQDSAPRYHARDVALVRARRLGAAVILGSATPALESSWNAEAGKYHLLRLDSRINEVQLPEVDIIDMGREVREGGIMGALSRPLRLAMREAIGQGGHVLLLLNRRGYTSFFYCPQCREALECPHCDVTLSHHLRPERLECHLCGHQQPPVNECPKCGAEVTRLGMGTERLEEELTRLFPSQRLLRLDQDTTSAKGSWEDYWRQLEAGEADIIFGTQMIAKGLHLERITCVGVILADITLNQPDFRSQERAFSLITQVAGRAGRGTRAGHVYVQTYQPHHYALRYAARHDYDGFRDQELRRRRVAQFPPFRRVIAVTLSGPEPAALVDHAEALAGTLRLIHMRLGPESFDVLGPTPAPVARIKDMWRQRVLLRGERPSMLRGVLREALDTIRRTPRTGWREHRLAVDVDPYDLL